MRSGSSISVWALVVVGFLICSPGVRAVGGTTAPADPGSAKLDKATSVYREKFERFKADLLKDLDAKENLARGKGDRKLVDEIKAERAAFVERGTLPKAVPTTVYETRVKQARGEVEAAYAAAIKELTRTREDARAAVVEAQLAEFRAEADGAAGVVDLLAMVDLAQDVLKGQWSRDGRSLTNALNRTDQVGIRLPYLPPDEYELELMVTRVGGENDMMIGGLVAGRQVVAMLDGYGTTLSGIHMVDGQPAAANPSTFKGKLFTNGKPATVVARFSKEGVTVSVDGKQVLKAGPAERLGGATLGVPAGQTSIWLAPNASYRIDVLRLRPISGRGKSLR